MIGAPDEFGQGELPTEEQRQNGAESHCRTNHNNPGIL